MKNLNTKQAKTLIQNKALYGRKGTLEKIINWLWKRYTNLGKYWVTVENEQKEYQPTLETQALLDHLRGVEQFASGGVLFMKNSVIHALVSQSKVVWIQTDFDGKLQQIFTSVNENDYGRLIGVLTGTVRNHDLIEAKEKANQALKELRFLLEHNRELKDYGKLQIAEVCVAKTCAALMRVRE